MGGDTILVSGNGSLEVMPLKDFLAGYYQHYSVEQLRILLWYADCKIGQLQEDLDDLEEALGDAHCCIELNFVREQQRIIDRNNSIDYSDELRVISCE